MKRALSILLFLLTFQGFAQEYKRTYNWYFGDSAGISFSTNPPTALTDGKMFTWEGCATISDTNGNLLFYTNGEKVWNKNHQLMENGTLLKGSMDATQSSIIIPQPGNDSLFYLFTVDALGQFNGFQYSVVNIQANSGLGKVSVKNIKLLTPVCEKITATRHQNGRDVWVMVHEFKSNKFYAYLLTPQGLNTCAVISAIGSTHFTSSVIDAQGDLKFSPDGKKLAVCVYDFNQNRIDLFKFNKVNGTVTDYVPINNVILPYSVELSPNGKFLYATNRVNNVYQYNLNVWQSSAIRNSQTDLYIPKDNLYNYHNVLQLGSDDRIYIALVDSSFISVINYPDSAGLSCNFQLNGVAIGGKRSLYGLPNFVTSFFYKPQLDFSYQQSCSSNTISFSPATGPTGGLKWYFKNLFTNQTDSSTAISLAHTFTDTGWYEVKLCGSTDTVSKNIYIAPKPDIGKDTILCSSPAFLLSASLGLRCWQWSTGSDSATASVNQTGVYYLSAYNSNTCLVSDTISIVFADTALPVITEQRDTLSTGLYASYQWFFNDTPITNSNSKQIIIPANGLYKVTITDSLGCIRTSPLFNATGVGVKTVTDGYKIRIYPNPVKDILYIEVAEGGSITVHDLAGKTVLNTVLKKGKNTLDTSKLSQGSYLLSYQSETLKTYIKLILK